MNGIMNTYLLTVGWIICEGTQALWVTHALVTDRCADALTPSRVNERKHAGMMNKMAYCAHQRCLNSG